MLKLSRVNFYHFSNVTFDIYGYIYIYIEKKAASRAYEFMFEIFIEIKYVVSMNLQNPLFRSVYV